MKLSREKFLETLVRVRPGLSKKGIIESTNHFVFGAGQLTTYNDKIAIIHPFDYHLDISVPAEEFYKIINDIDSNVINLVQKKDNLLIKAKGTVAKISGKIDSEIDKYIKSSGVHDVSKWKKLPSNFIKASFLCMFSSSKDMTYMPLTCIKYYNNFLYSTDEHRVSMHKLKKNLGESFLLPATSVMELTKYNVSHFSNGDGWVYFKTPDNIIFCARKIEGKFPAIKKYFDINENDCTKINLPKKLSSAVQAVSVMTDAEFEIDRSISFTMADEKIALQGRKDIGYIKKTLPVTYASPEIKFEINPTFLREILKITGEVIIGENLLLFKSGNFKHIIAI